MTWTKRDMWRSSGPLALNIGGLSALSAGAFPRWTFADRTEKDRHSAHTVFPPTDGLRYSVFRGLSSSERPMVTESRSLPPHRISVPLGKNPYDPFSEIFLNHGNPSSWQGEQESRGDEVLMQAISSSA
ncbi:hypothetical protein SODALDRAFT_361570 [Sodiomyces alkalinus F11]|uniref:Uncharacterized protein n=1 Tax=Sodiomyces alkalinus (strain CBS 110278 / VKM F-3762 / F11) TaxID=1314773 RepID=A0A3N2PQL3_SODAK|nr:hypothetical protein SODALDRAFT_361570 [Sodiomyces alkalinus F11]ROT36754.1 hypothetical protein SODALDRAFT_361570 [Sodiomyces alkalinus F11]